MMLKSWMVLLLGISVCVLWRTSCWLAFLFPDKLHSVVFTLCLEPHEEDFVFCPNYTPLHTVNQTPPYHLSALPSNDYSMLINLEDFKFLNDLNCGKNRSLLVAVVHSAPANFDKRQAIRTTWATRIKTFFMVGQVKSTKLARKLDKEIAEYGDIVQGSFQDSYRNLTYKHAMVLKWVSYWCQNATYVLKTDDDIFVHAGNLYKFLRHNLTRHGARRLILCQFSQTFSVHRSYRSIWRISKKEYPKSSFPVFCAGAAVVYSPDVVFELYSETQRTPYFWIDDAHVTGTVASQVNITPTHLGPKLFRWEDSCEKIIQRRSLKEDFLLFCLTSRPEQVKSLWDLHQSFEPSYVISDG